MITLLPKKLVKVALFALVTSAMVFGSFLVNPDIVGAQTPLEEQQQQIAEYQNFLNGILNVEWYQASSLADTGYVIGGNITITSQGNQDSDGVFDNRFGSSSIVGGSTEDMVVLLPSGNSQAVYLKAKVIDQTNNTSEVVHVNLMQPSGYPENKRRFTVSFGGLSPATAHSNILQFQIINTTGDLSTGPNATTLAAGEGNVHPESSNDLGGQTGLDAALETDDLECEVETLLTNCVIHFLYEIVYPTTSWLLAAGGQVLDIFTSFAITSKVYKDSTFVTSGWSIVRDISNIFFIFILLVAAFRTIFGAAGVEKTIKNVIIIALLINFSLFMVKVVIDASNILAHLFYDRISVPNTTNQDLPADIPLNYVGNQKNLSVGITRGLAVQNIISGPGVDQFLTELGQNRATLAVIIVFGIIVNVIAAIAFFKVGILMLSRIVGLWLSMILSPLAFVMYLVPGAATYVKSFSFTIWMRDMIKYAFLAPVFLFFIYLIIIFINSNFIDGFLQTSNYSGTERMIVISLSFMVIIGLLKTAESTAKDMSGEIGAQISKVTDKAMGAVAGVAGGVALGGAGVVGRATIGRAAAGLAKSKGLKEAAAQKGVTGFLARKTLRQADKTSKRDFDIRTSGLGKSIQSSLGSALGTKINFNNQAVQTAGLDQKAGKGGYTGAVDARKKDQENFAKQFELKDEEKKAQNDRASEYNKDAATHEDYLRQQPAMQTETKQVVDENGEVVEKTITQEEKVAEEMKGFREDYEKGGTIQVAEETKAVKGGSVDNADIFANKLKDQYAETLRVSGGDSTKGAIVGSIQNAVEESQQKPEPRREREYKRDAEKHEDYLRGQTAMQTTKQVPDPSGAKNADGTPKMVTQQVPDMDKISAAMTKFKAGYEKGGDIEVAGQTKSVQAGIVETPKPKTNPNTGDTAASASLVGGAAAAQQGLEKVLTDVVAGTTISAGKASAGVVGAAGLKSFLESFAAQEGDRRAADSIGGKAKEEGKAATNIAELKELLAEAKGETGHSDDNEAIKEMIKQLQSNRDIAKAQAETARKTYLATLQLSKSKPGDQKLQVEVAERKTEYLKQHGEQQDLDSKISDFKNFQKNMTKNKEILSGGNKKKEEGKKEEEKKEEES